MRILHVTKYASMRGGIERYIADLARDQLSRKHQVSILGVQEQNPEWIPATHRETPTAQFTFASAPISIGFPMTYRRMAAQSDVVHFHYPNPIGELSALLFPDAGRAHVATYHADISRAKPLSRMYARMAVAFLDMVDAVIVTSGPLLDGATELRDLRAKTHVIPLGVDLSRFPPRNRPAAGGALFVGRLIPYKGLDVLLDAVALNPGVRLTIVGDGPLRDSLTMQIRRSGLEARVTMSGRVSDEALLQLYHAADVLVLPSVSRAEAFGYVLLEAMATGCAVISTEVGSATSWVNQDGVTGMVVEPGNVAALAGALRTLFANAELLSRMQAAAVQRSKDFQVEMMCSSVEAVYEKMLADVASGAPRTPAHDARV